MDKCYIIPTQKACNADCSFCISKSRIYDKNDEFLLITSQFVSNIEYLTKKGINKFEITGGGEPLLNPDLDLIISIIRRINPSAYIKIYTNGLICKKLDVDEINISLTSLKDETNEKLMNYHSKERVFDRIKRIRELNPNTTIRLSIPLIKGSIDSKEKLDSLVNKTSSIVNRYVVRTLYPNTTNLESLYVDFEYDNPLVKIERDNDVKEFNGLILWSDGEIYSDWSLTRKQKMYSYLLLKPDSKEKVDEILSYIISSGFIIKDILLLDDFVNKASVLYDDKDPNYKEIVMRHLNNTSYLYGNTGLVVLLDKLESYEKLLEETYLLKKRLRTLFSFTGKYEGYVSKDENLSHLNIVHAPDPTIDNYQRDLRYIESLHLHRINEIEKGLILRYRSYTL